MRSRAIRIGEGHDDLAIGAIVASDVAVPGGRVALRKGVRLGEEHRETLARLAGAELHLVELEPGDVAQDEIASRLALALAGPGTSVGTPEQGQARIRAARRGLLRVDAAAVRAVNAAPPLLCFTLPDGTVVAEGDEVAGVKAAALAAPGALLARALERTGANDPAIRVDAFAPRRIAALITERLEARGRELVAGALGRKIEWYGSTLAGLTEVAHEPTAVAAALRRALATEPGLILVSGANPLDPLDPVLVAIASLGGAVLRTGVPAHPGSMVWIGRVGSTSVIGVATCAGFGKDTALDLLLPRVLAGEDAVAAADAIGHGGLAEGPRAAGRFPPYPRD